MARKNYLRWTREELDLLSREWPHGGLKAVRHLFPHRSDISLAGRASFLGLRITTRKTYTAYPQSDFVDAAIKREYANGRRPDLKSLEKAIGRPRGWIKYRAGVLGVRTEWTKGGRVWVKQEDDILEACRNAGMGVSAARARLKRAGYQRTLGAVCSRIDTLKLGFGREWWSLNEVAQLMGVDSHKVADWANAGLLRADRRIGNSNMGQPVLERYKMWSVTRESLQKFMLSHPERWDHRRMRKEVLLDLLCNSFNAHALRAAGV